MDLDGYFSCRKEETTYKVSYAHTLENTENFERFYLCESMRHATHISAEGQLVTCMGFCGATLSERFPSLPEQSIGELKLDSFYEQVASSRMEDLMAADPE